MAGTPACVDLMESTMGPTDPRCGPHGPFVDLMKSTMATCDPRYDRGWLSALRSKNVRISSSRSPSSTPSTSDVFTSVR